MVIQPNLVSGYAFIPLFSVPNFKGVGIMHLCFIQFSHLDKKNSEEKKKKTMPVFEGSYLISSDRVS